MGGPPDSRLALIELVERDGRVRQSVEVLAWPVTVGRALDNTIVLDDPHLAATHLRIGPGDDGELLLSVAEGAHNPVQLGRRRLRAGESAPLPRGQWSAGQSTLRVRWAGETLAPERPLAQVRPARGVALAALAMWAMVLAEFALALDPGAPLTAWLVPLVSVPFALTAWAALWGLMSKLFRQRFEFWPHASIALRWVLAATVLRWVVPMLAFAMSWPWLLGPVAVVSTAIFFGMLRAHALRVLPGRSRGITTALAAGLLAFVGVQAVAQHQATDRWLGPLYLSQLGPPGWRLAPAQPVARFIGDAASLKAELARNAAADLAREPDDDAP